MNELLSKEAKKHGDILTIVSSHRLNDLKNEIDLFAKSEKLNNFQKWIVNEMYNYDIPNSNLLINSIILIAISHPFYADVIFIKEGKEYFGKCFVALNFDETDKYLRMFLEEHGFQAIRANNLPLKRLGVQSGISEYGRNNITYIDGMGSNFSLVAYFSDMPCENDIWRSSVTAKRCNNCNICLDNCPTGAIRNDSFLIDNQKCLSAMNEVPGDFPDWLPTSVHHTCYDCLRCQEKCPMNIGHTDKIAECIIFSEQETEMLLKGRPIEELSEDMKQKILFLGLDQWYDAIPRNIKVLMNRE
ncbi:4Fe-4S double cluster binding domain-containing protein [Herbivorax sp. ANBcel31]|uniref:4Fe-4S double cluster binding domain-containing protein n=1 Tax=Herbivorax sp. ANBcel31 TaxID=3069754 RepID=UPI0027B56410|nr:4Fe-4S double cluster binding domain-containing protein [Herbivorax sp. ANBcel31]MDQ2087997.1 4Fe-4S double cluster binding domain-containing protein [Herbivorax sp. ANBcel31]